MNKKRGTALLAAGLFVLGLAQAEAASCVWKDANPSTPALVQNKGFFQFWVGEIRSYCETPGQDLDAYTPVKVLITHVTDKSDYGCRELVDFRLGELDDATATSFALRACN